MPTIELRLGVCLLALEQGAYTRRAVPTLATLDANPQHSSLLKTKDQGNPSLTFIPPCSLLWYRGRDGYTHVHMYKDL